MPTIDDFYFRVGESYTHCVIVTSRHHNDAKDLTNGGKTYSSATAGTSAGTAQVILTVFTTGTSPVPILTKDTGPTPILASDISLSVNPLASTSTVPCAILLNFTQADAATLVPGTYTYEVRVVLNGIQKVVYPLDDNTASFSIYDSETWNALATPPAPRITRYDEGIVLPSNAPVDILPKDLWNKLRDTSKSKRRRR